MINQLIKSRRSLPRRRCPLAAIIDLVGAGGSLAAAGARTREEGASAAAATAAAAGGVAGVGGGRRLAVLVAGHEDGLGVVALRRRQWRQSGFGSGRRSGYLMCV